MKIAVTGAFGYSGKFITEKLIEQAHEVCTLTNSNQKNNPFGKKIKVFPLSFEQADKLIQNLQNYDVLINTYWVRFNHKRFNHHEAVENTKTLFNAAKTAGIKRIIHVSITNPDENSDLEYFKGKGQLENYLKQLGLNYAIIRPAVLFGEGDILINNIAWMVKHLPIMGVFGDGEYKLQPIHVKDFAKMIVNEVENKENKIINAIGAETYSYIGLVRKLMQIFELKKPIVKVSPIIGYLVGRIISTLKKDITITRPEIKGLMNNTLFVEENPTGKTKLSEWAKKNKSTLGEKYASELKRR